MTLHQHIEQCISAQNSRLCLGLDSDIEKLPESVDRNLNGLLEFNKRIIDQTKDIVAAYKLNIAFYECYGAEGWNVLDETLKYIPKKVFKIADAKRADIGNTSKYYAKTYFEIYRFDAVTVAPYMGYDSLQPFLEYSDKGIIVLALTSNDGSSDFQKQKMENGDFLFESVIKKLDKWNTRSNIMLVVGATNKEEIKTVRALMKNAFFLVPGIGAQGGKVEDVIANAGKNVLINSSRSLIYASQKKDFDLVCREKTIELNSLINEHVLALP